MKAKAKAARGARVSEADLLAHYYRVVNEHPAEPTTDPASVPPALAESLRRLARPSVASGGSTTAEASAGAPSKTSKKRARRSAPAPASTTGPALGDGAGGEYAALTMGSDDVGRSGNGSKKRARQSEPPATTGSESAAATSTTTRSTPAKRKRTSGGGVLTTYGPCPFVFRFSPKERGTYLESEYEWVEGRWCDGVNRGGRGAGGVKSRGKGQALEDSSTIPPKGEEHEGLLANESAATGVGASGSRTAGTGTETVADGSTPANVKVKGRSKAQGGDGESATKRKQREKAVKGTEVDSAGLRQTTDSTTSTSSATGKGTITAMSKPTSSYETPTRQPIALPSSSQPDQPPSSQPNGDMPQSQPTPTRPSKKGHASKKDRLSQLRLDSSQSGPPPAPDHPATPVHALAAVEEGEDEDEDELEHTPVVPKAKSMEKSKGARKKRDAADADANEAPVEADKNRSKTNTKTTSAGSRKRKSDGESADTSEEAREVVEQLLGTEGGAMAGGTGTIDTPKTKKGRESKKHKSTHGPDPFATPRANGDVASDAQATAEKRSKKPKHDHGEDTPSETAQKESHKKDKRRKKERPGWVVNTPEATKS